MASYPSCCPLRCPLSVFSSTNGRVSSFSMSPALLARWYSRRALPGLQNCCSEVFIMSKCYDNLNSNPYHL
ncbi:hypothetical protein L596_018319 [Steinernema carpocapsae]|uniref:Uncharacterized protein n=1 Tax=Steinernema carpocapsae TaxID=34508 RepID=A0A4U5N502_STECR|nr:hypothetical protein L596_018319 [Steinernema carpocapsae]